MFFEIRNLLRPLTETASPVEQRRIGSYAFINGVVKLLEHDPRAVVGPRDLAKPPNRWETQRDYID